MSRVTISARQAIGDDPGWVAVQSVLFGAIALAGPLGRRRSRHEAGRSNIIALLAGVTLVAGGLKIGAQARSELGESFTMSPTPLPDRRLVDTGVYGVIRHPMYASVLLVATGYALAWRSLPAAFGTMVATAFVALKIRREETRLRQRYARYDDYAQSVRWRVIPGVM